MKIVLGSDLKIIGAPDYFLRNIRGRLSFPNPQWEANDKMNRWNGNTPRTLSFFRENENGLSVPRGFTGQLISMAKRSGIRYQLDDQRRVLPGVDFTFSGILKPFQQEAVDAMIKKDFGTFAAPTGSGKTIIALATTTERRQPTLIIVHSKELLTQWIQRIEQFLKIPRTEIGQIGNGKHSIGKKITVGIVNSVYSIADEVRDYIGFLIVDECHRTPSRTFTETVSAFDCMYMLGLSATPWRRDGLSKLIFWYLGDVQHAVDKAVLIESGDILRAEVVTRKTNFVSHADPQEEYSRMLSELTEDTARNKLIATDVIREATNDGGVCLVLSDRKEHCRTLAGLVEDQGIKVSILTGTTPAKERHQIVTDLNDGNIRVLASTTQLLSEGFDAKALQTLFLVTPIKFDGRLMQCLGRILRPTPGKDHARVYDYIDANVGVLAASARARKRVYSQLGGFR